MDLYTMDDQYSKAISAIESSFNELYLQLIRCEIGQVSLQKLIVPQVEVGRTTSYEASSELVEPQKDKEVLSTFIQQMLPSKRIDDSEPPRLVGLVQVKCSDQQEQELLKLLSNINLLKTDYRNLISTNFDSEAKRRHLYRNHPVLNKYWVKTIERQVNFTNFDIRSIGLHWSDSVMSFHPLELGDVKALVKAQPSEAQQLMIDALNDHQPKYNQLVQLKAIKIQPIQRVRWRNEQGTISKKNLRAHSPFLVINGEVKKCTQIGKRSFEGQAIVSEQPDMRIMIPSLSIYERTRKCRKQHSLKKELIKDAEL